MPHTRMVWRMLLLPWPNARNGSIMVTIWPCIMPGFHRCSLGGLHTPAAKPVVVTQEEEEEAEEILSSSPSLPEVVLQQHQCPPHSHHSLHFWLTILPIALIFTILLVSEPSRSRVLYAFLRPQFSIHLL